MSKVSGTDFLASFMELGVSQPKSSSEDGAGLFAAMLQGIPAEGDAAEATVVATTAVAATATATSNTAAQPQVTQPLPDGAAAVQATLELPPDVTATLAAQFAVENNAEATDVDEDADANFSAAADASAATEQSAASAKIALATLTMAATQKPADAQPAPRRELQGPEAAPVAEEHTLADAEATPTVSEKSVMHEAAEHAPAKISKQNTLQDQTDSTAPALVLAETDAAPAAESDLLALSASAGATEPKNAGDAVNSNVAGNSAAPGIVFEDDSASEPLATRSGTTGKRDTRSGVAYSFMPGFGAAISGKNSPPGGKSLPAGREDYSRVRAATVQPALLAGFTPASGLEDSSLAFDNMVAQAFAATELGNGAQQAAPNLASAPTFDLALGDIQGDAGQPELLPESATAMLESTSTMGSEVWVDETATQLSWLRDQGLEKAHIRLHPEELGSLDVSITINEGQAYVQFVTATAEARELLQNSLPSLRELLQQSGLALAEGNVSQGDTGKEQGFAQHAQQHERFVQIPEVQPQANNWARPAQQGRSQVDYYI